MLGLSETLPLSPWLPFPVKFLDSQQKLHSVPRRMCQSLVDIRFGILLPSVLCSSSHSKPCNIDGSFAYGEMKGQRTEEIIPKSCGETR